MSNNRKIPHIDFLAEQTEEVRDLYATWDACSKGIAKYEALLANKDISSRKKRLVKKQISCMKRYFKILDKRIILEVL